MNRFTCIALILGITTLPHLALAQPVTGGGKRNSPAPVTGAPLTPSTPGSAPPTAPDPQIQQMLGELSARELAADVRGLVAFGTRHSLSDTQSRKRGIGAARRWTMEKLEGYSKASGGRLRVELDTFTVAPDGKRITQRVAMANVLARLPGTDPADPRVLLVSGHLDSRRTDVMDATGDAPGANDDGSGVALVLELARVMAKRSFPCTLIFAAVQGEEQGLYGSKHLAARAKREGWQVMAMLNNDIVGNSHGSDPDLTDSTRLRVFSEGIPAAETPEEALLRRQLSAENDSRSRQLARYAREAALRYVPGQEVVLEYRPDRFLRGGDHTPFSQQGFTAVRFTEMHEDFRHQHQDPRVRNDTIYGDNPEFVDYHYLRRNAAVNLATLASLALAPDVPRQVQILTARLTNRTQLRWQPPVTGPRPVGYYVLVRETSSPVWQQRRYVTTPEADLPLSKDNYLFGVAAVDAAGHESLPVLPVPAK